MIVEVPEKIRQLKMEPYEKIVRLIIFSSDELQRFAAKREILNRTRMTRIARIFTDNRIRAYPRHPRNPCSIVYTAQPNWKAATGALNNGWGQIAAPLSVQTTGNRQNSNKLLKLFPSCETNVVIPSTSNARLTDEVEDFKPLEFERFRSEAQADTEISI